MLAFEPTFVEVRHVESGALMQIIPGNSLRCLFADTPPSASSSQQAGSYFPQQYGGYGNSPRFPPPGSVRTEIIIADADRVFSRAFIHLESRLRYTRLTCAYDCSTIQRVSFDAVSAIARAGR